MSMVNIGCHIYYIVETNLKMLDRYRNRIKTYLYLEREGVDVAR
jgi:hypothetical protein